MGAPQYEVAILNTNGEGAIKDNLTTTTSKKERTIAYSSTIKELENDTIKLTFHSDNIQNIVHFSSIVVTYQCVKG